MASKFDPLPKQIADKLSSHLSETVPQMAEALASTGLVRSDKLPFDEAGDMVSRRWADPQFRGRLLQAVGDKHFLALAKSLGHYTEPEGGTDLNKLPQDLQDQQWPIPK